MISGELQFVTKKGMHDECTDVDGWLARNVRPEIRHTSAASVLGERVPTLSFLDADDDAAVFLPGEAESSAGDLRFLDSPVESATDDAPSAEDATDAGALPLELEAAVAAAAGVNVTLGDASEDAEVDAGVDEAATLVDLAGEAGASGAEDETAAARRASNSRIKSAHPSTRLSAGSHVDSASA